MLEHFVLFAAAQGRERDLEVVLEEFSRAVSSTCTTLHEINWGRNTNPSGLKRGLTHGCLARIADDGFQEYWDNPAHQRLLGQLDDLCVDRFAMDHLSPALRSGADAVQPELSTTLRKTQ
jgi:Stress responsive A/B Barrel Domain